MKQLLFFLSVFFINFIVFAQESTVNLTDKNKTVIIGKEVSYLEDKEGKLTIEQINSSDYQLKFIASDMATLNFGVMSESYYWVKINIKNTTTENEWVLELAFALFQNADWFMQNDNKIWQIYKDGYEIPEIERSMQNRYPAIRVFIPQNSFKTVYLKFKGNSLACPLMVQNAKKYQIQHRFRDISFGAMQAIILLISLISLYFYLSYRKISYLVFVIFLISAVIFIALYQGYLNVAFLKWLTYLNNIFILLYPIFLLKIPSHFPKIYKFTKLLLIYFILIYIIGFFLPNNLFNIIGQINYIGITLPFATFLGIISFRNRSKEAILYLIGLVAQFLFSLAEVVSINLGINPPLINLLHLGIFIEVLVFTYALVRQTVNEQTELKVAKENAQKEMLEQIKENARLVAAQNEILEEKVKIRTLELNQTNEELATSNEELYQTQEEILSQRDLLENKNNLLEQYTHKIGKSIGAAKMIQKAILPPKDKMKELFEEHFVLFRPKDIVSGDFWWANEVNGEKYLIVADCTGHGVSGAMLTMIGSSLLDRIIRLLGVTEPAEILVKLHEEIKAVLQQDQTKNNEGMDIAITHWHYENEECFLSFAAAKRPLLYAYQGQIEKIAGSRRNIGGKIDSMKSFETKTFTLSKGTCLYLCSDGYGDQNNVERNNFSEKRLINLLQQIQDLPMEQQKEILKTQLTEHMENTEQRDDILVIGVRI